VGIVGYPASLKPPLFVQSARTRDGIGSSMVTEQEIGWLAGLFDGEGCISYTRNHRKNKIVTYVSFSITNTEEVLLQKAQAILDSLEIDSSLRSCDSGRANSKLVYRLHINSSAGIRRFFSKIPIQSKAKLEKYATLQPFLTNNPRSHTEAKRKRLARQYPALL